MLEAEKKKNLSHFDNVDIVSKTSGLDPIVCFTVSACLWEQKSCCGTKCWKKTVSEHTAYGTAYPSVPAGFNIVADRCIDSLLSSHAVHM